MKNISPLMRLLILAACLSLLAACAPAPTPTPAPTTDVAAIQTQAVQDAYAGMTAAAPIVYSTSSRAGTDSRRFRWQLFRLP